MKVALIVLNALAITASVGLVLIYTDGRGDWGAGDTLKVLVFLSPCLAALFALRERSSSLARSVAGWCSAVWAVPLVVLGIGASTGIGGFVGLLIVIVPALLLLSLNWFWFVLGTRTLEV